jgi:hypothetical protein
MKTNTFFLGTLVLALGLLFIVSCTKDKVMPKDNIGPVDPVEVGDCPDTISYQQSIEPLININCSVSGCHNSSGAGGYILTSHNQVSANANVIFGAIMHNPGTANMPQGAAQLADSSIMQFECWMNQGKANN